MTDTFEKLSDITKRITDRLEPVRFEIHLNGPLAVKLFEEATKSGNRAETLIAEAVRAYFGEAA